MEGVHDQNGDQEDRERVLDRGDVEAGALTAWTNHTEAAMAAAATRTLIHRAVGTG